MKIQVHTPKSIIELDTEVNTEKEFAIYGLDRNILIEKSIEEKVNNLEQKVIELENKITTTIPIIK